ncbi:MAG TPA: hypothetical protein VK995_04465 [Oceanipulchritudo sp.]|nr:hypothetical protein [Oceanipulchritudo sp.]
MFGKDSRWGFTTVEVVVLISLLSLLALVAVPSYLSHRANSQASCLSKKFRTYAIAFQAYAEQEGTWPPDQTAGQVPLGMESRLPAFDEESIVGGQWDWDGTGGDHPPAVSLIAPKASWGVLTRIDRILDDGNLNTGILVYNENKVTLLLAY